MVLLWWRCRALLVIFTTTAEQTYFLSLSLSHSLSGESTVAKSATRYLFSGELT